MRTNYLILAFVALMTFTAGAQKFITKTGHIKLYSDGAVEKIEAHNRQVNSALDVATGDFVFKVLLKSFEFEKALMQEHFNENYVESDKFPNSTFVGKVINIKDVNIAKDGTYDVVVEGKLTMHGVTNNVRTKGTLEMKQGKLIGKDKFTLTLADYKISIPGAVVNSISKTIDITVDVTLDKAN
ncbi:MAG: YceI family protein [Bacteroidota bacterium]